MVQFCYWRLYLGIETVPVVCCDGWQGWTWIETWKSWANFSKFSCYACKKTPQNVWYLLHISNGAFFCVGKGTKWWLWHRIDLKQQYPRDIAPLTLLSPNSDWTNINFLLTISRDCQEQSLWELIKWSQREKSLIFYQILPTNSLNEMYGDQSAEFVYGSWGLTG